MACKSMGWEQLSSYAKEKISAYHTIQQSIRPFFLVCPQPIRILAPIEAREAVAYRPLNELFTREFGYALQFDFVPAFDMGTL